MAKLWWITILDMTMATVILMHTTGYLVQTESQPEFRVGSDQTSAQELTTNIGRSFGTRFMFRIRSIW
jgi:hypothetical protein